MDHYTNNVSVILVDWSKLATAMQVISYITKTIIIKNKDLTKILFLSSFQVGLIIFTMLVLGIPLMLDHF